MQEPIENVIVVIFVERKLSKLIDRGVIKKIADDLFPASHYEDPGVHYSGHFLRCFQSCVRYN